MNEPLPLVVEKRTADDANVFEYQSGDKYRFDRFSETRGVYIFIRRSKPRE